MSRNLNNINTSVRSLNNLEKNNLAGVNLNKIGNIINLDTDLINLNTINTFKIGLTTDNIDNQFLIKSISYTDGDILQIDSNNKLNKITVNSILGNLTGGANITKTNNTLDLDTNLINLSTINTFKIGLSAIGNASTLLRNSLVLESDDYLKINSDGFVVGVSLKENKNAILGADNTSGIIVGSNMSKTVDVTNGDITLTSTNTTYSGGTNINLNGTAINLDTDLTNLNTINTFKIGLSAIANASTLLRNSEVLSNSDYLQINSDGFVVGVSLKENKNAILGSDNTSGIIAGSNITKTVNTSNGNITLTSTNTTYTNGTNITISNQNAISSDQKTTLIFNSGQKLRGTGNSTNIRDIAYVDSNNDIIFGDNQNNCGFLVANGIFFYGDGTPLISNLRVFNSSGLNNIGNINNLSGNINLTNENKINFNNDANNSIGSQGALAGIELKGFNNVLIRTSVANKPTINVGQTAIKCKGKITGEFLTGTTERDLLQVLTDNSIQLGDASCELSVKGTLTTFESGNPLEIYNNIKFKNSVTSSYIVNSSGNSLLGINTAGDLINIFGNGVDKTTIKGSNINFEGFSSFNGDIQMVQEKKLYFNVGLLSNNNWIKATTEDNQPIGLNIQGDASIKLTTETFGGEVFLNGNTLAISANLTTYDNDITTTNSDLTIDGDFTGADCDISIDGDIKLALLSEINLNRNDTTTVYNYIRANGSIPLNNTPGTGSGTGGGVEIKGFNTVLLSQSYNTSVNNAELWVHSNRVNVSATTFNYPTGGGSGSDDRIKFNEIPVDFDCLEIIKNLQVEVYDKHFIKDKDKFMDREIGIIAQDSYNKIKNLVNSDTADLFVSEIDYTIKSNFKENGDIVEDQMKRVIHTDMVSGETTETIEENILAVSYIRFISVLIKSQQQQQEQYFLEKSKIKKLEEIISQQQIIIDKLINSTTFSNFKKNI